jgi:hypothetical protein
VHASGQPVRHQQGQHRNADGNHRKPQGGLVTAGHLRVAVDGCGDGARLAGNVGNKSDGGTEFTQSFGKAQNGTGKNT